MKLFYSDDEIKKHDAKRKAMKDTLTVLKEQTPWDIFLPIIKKAFKGTPPKAPGGRPAYSYNLMMKILILQRLYNLSDFQMEYQILDRSSFKEFLDLDPTGPVPDEKTIWHFRNALAKKKADIQLFEAFDEFLQYNGLIAREGVIVDASFIEVPKAHLKKDEKEAASIGASPESWDKPETLPRIRQMDQDARWTQKNGINFFGYKNHIKIDAQSKLILSYKVTPASVHDSPILPELIDIVKDKGQEVYADKAYTGMDNQVFIKGNELKSRVMEKAVRGKPLTEAQEEKNRQKSKIRSRIEHVFGFMENSMGGMSQRGKGLERISLITGLMNLAYNIFRYNFLQRA